MNETQPLGKAEETLSAVAEATRNWLASGYMNSEAQALVGRLDAALARERVIAGEVADVEEAMKSPDNYVLHCSFLGFSLSKLGSPFETLLPLDKAIAFHQLQLDRYIAERERRLDELTKA